MTRPHRIPLALALLLTSTELACTASDPSSASSGSADRTPEQAGPDETAPEVAASEPSAPEAVTPEADATAKPDEVEPSPEADAPDGDDLDEPESFVVAIEALVAGAVPSEEANATAWTHYKAAQYVDAQRHFALAALHEPTAWKPAFNMACAAALAKDEAMTHVALREAVMRDQATVQDKAKTEGDLAIYRDEDWFQKLLGPDPFEALDADAAKLDSEFAAEDLAAEALLARAEDPPDVPIVAVKTKPMTAQWREVSRPSEALTLVDLMGGVLAKGASGYYDVSAAGELVMRPEIEAPAAELIGYWPHNVWTVEVRDETDPRDRSGDKEFSIRLMRLRNERRWVPQAYNDMQRWTDNGEDFRVGAKGGLLVRDPESLMPNTVSPAFTRVAGGAGDPDFYEYVGEIVEWMETNSARIYAVCRHGDRLVVQRECEDLECGHANMFELPLGQSWTFGQARPRKRHSVSLVASNHGSGDKHHLLHYEFVDSQGAWTLESLPREPTGLWATDDGGLWLALGDAIWYRDPSGSWSDVALPPGASSISAALRPEPSELWIAATVAGKQVVYATPTPAG